MEENIMEMDIDPVDIIIQKREEMNISPKQVAEAIGISEEYYKKTEKKIAPITEVSAEKLSAFYQTNIRTIKRDRHAIKPKRSYKTIQDVIPKRKPEEPDFAEPQYKVLNRELKRQNKILAQEIIRLSNIIEKILTIGETVDEYTPGLMPSEEE
jgi:transcriptional regulator with XRE-family HTH domain